PLSFCDELECLTVFVEGPGVRCVLAGVLVFAFWSLTAFELIVGTGDAFGGLDC
ncbi:11392_t:CDS:1, partial [Gigaspora rosea]